MKTEQKTGRSRVMTRRALRVSAGLAVIYAGLVMVASCSAYRVIFQPPAATYELSDEMLQITTGDGERLAALYLRAATPGYTILFCHGNAEDLGQLGLRLERYQKLGFDVLAYDYRSYGQSTGTPDEENAYADAELMYAYATNRLQIAPERLIVYGRSLGCAMALRIASRHRVAGLIVESPFYTAYRVVTQVPLVWFDKFPNKDMIREVQCPVFVMHGLDDWIIQPWQGKKLYALAGEPKQCLWVEGAGHNDVMTVADKEYDRSIERFMVSVKKHEERL